jgi:hypothetical protein
MPAEQRGQPYKLGPGRWGLRYYDAGGARKRKSGFSSRSAALAHYRDVLRPQILGLPVARPETTLAQLADVFLERHAAVRSPRTIRTLRERLRRPLKAYGSTPLGELERMSGELADFAAELDGFRYAVMSALRQVLAAGIRWGYLTTIPPRSRARIRFRRLARYAYSRSSSSTRSRLSSARRSGLSSRSAPRPGSGRRNGPGLSVETSIASAERSPFEAQRRTALAARFRSRHEL